MNEKICDFRFLICDLASAGSGNSGGSYYSCQFAGLLPKFLHPSWRQQSALDNQFNPISRFICFLFYGSQSRNELRFGTSATSGPVICSDRRPTPHQLRRDSPAFWRPRQCSDQFKNAECKLFCSLLQLHFIHTNLRFAGASPNRKSKI